jgi:hypothetical protein
MGHVGSVDAPISAEQIRRNEERTQIAKMVPFYAARVSDLGTGDFVRVECACGHQELIPAMALTQGLRLSPDARIVDLEPRLRCRECDAKGKAVVSVR